MNAPLLLLLCALSLASATEKRGTEYYNNPERPFSFSHFTQELPANQGLLKLLPSVQKSPPQQQQLTIVPLYIERQVPVPVEHLPIITKVPVLYQYQGEDRPNTYPHLKPYYKQIDR